MSISHQEPEAQTLPFGTHFRVINFEPGDGTRYCVAFGLISQTDAHRQHWGSRTTCFFGFAQGGSSIVGGTLATDSPCDFGYFCQQVQIKNAYVANAAYLAFCALIGGQPLNPLHEPETCDWKAGWERQLAAGWEACEMAEAANGR
jgi:hypothetical protein